MSRILRRLRTVLRIQGRKGWLLTRSAKVRQLIGSRSSLSTGVQRRYVRRWHTGPVPAASVAVASGSVVARYQDGAVARQ